MVKLHPLGLGDTMQPPVSMSDQLMVDDVTVAISVRTTHCGGCEVTTSSLYLLF